MNMLNYKHLLLLLIICASLNLNLNAQDNVGIGTTTPNASSILELSATDKGFLVPRLTTAQRNAIGTPATGLIIFNTESGTFEYYSGSSWIQLFSGSFFNLDNGKIFVGDINGDAAQVTMSGDATLSNTGVLTIGDDKITTGKILDANVTNAKLATGIDVAKLADGSISNTEFQFLNNVSSNIQDQLDGKASATLNSGEIFVGNGSNLAQGRIMGGDATLSNTGVLTIGNDKITTAKILDGNITTAKLANNSVDGTKINLTDNANGDLMYYNGTDWVRLAPGTSGHILQTNGAGNAPTWVASSLTLDNGEIFVGNASSVPTSVPMSGDATINNTGLLTIANGAVTDAKLGTGINANKIANGTVDNTKFQYLGNVTSDIQTQLNSKMTNALPSGYIFVGNGSGVATGVQPSGNISVGTNGALNIAAGQITDAMVSLAANIDVVKLGEGTNGQIIRTNGTAVEWWTPNYLVSGTTAGGDLSGLYPNPTVDALQGRAVHSAAPVDGQVLTWNNTDSRWEPQTPSASSGWTLTGNSLAGTEVLGSTNAQPLVLVTNNSERMRIWDDGQIGINYATVFEDSIKVWLDGDMVIDGDLIVTGTIDPLALQLVPQTSIPSGLVNKEGFIYYDDNSNTIKITNGTTWSDLGSNLTNGLDLKNSDNAAKELKFYEPSSSGTDYTAFKAQAQASPVTYTLPSSDGDDGDVLTTDGTGGLSWEAPATPAMTDTTITTATTINGNHDIYILSGQSAGFNINLPLSSNFSGKKIIIKARPLTSSQFTYKIAPQSGDLLEYTSTFFEIFSRPITGLQLRGIIVYSDGSRWHIISTVNY